MNAALQAARKKFKNQKGKISTGYDNSNLPEGRYVCNVVQSELGESKKGAGDCVHIIRLVVSSGEQKGRSLWPYKPDISEIDGVVSVAKNMKAILGDVIPGKLDVTTNQFEVDFDKFLATSEKLAHDCVGVVVEATVKDGKTKKNDGSFWQSTYINRALGEDANAAEGKTEKKRSIHQDGDGMDMGGKGKGKAPAAKKKVAKKKVVKKKR